MYLVISAWEPLPGKEQPFMELGNRIGAMLKRQPGVLLLEVFLSGGKAMSVHGYADEATYRRLVDDPDGPFARAVADSNLETVARWLYSERGETVPLP